MFQFFINAEGGLTAAGYAVTILAAILFTVAAIILAGKESTRKKLSIKQLAYCSMALALSFITSYIKIFELPFGVLLPLSVCFLLY